MDLLPATLFNPSPFSWGHMQAKVTEFAANLSRILIKQRNFNVPVKVRDRSYLQAEKRCWNELLKNQDAIRFTSPNYC
jgi:uncharacterized membrane protein affecting hemolysin expression